MRRHLLLPVSLVMTMALINGCNEATGPADDVRVEWALSSGIVEAHDSVAATLILRNPGSAPVVLVSSCTSIGGVQLAIDGNRVGVRGAGDGCFPAVTEYTIPASDSLIHVFRFNAETSFGQPLGPGVYSVNFDSHVRELRGRVSPAYFEVR